MATILAHIEIEPGKEAQWAAIMTDMVRSAAFATFATFASNFLRRRRPLSSVAPLLFFCSWTLIFQPSFILANQEVNSQHIMFCFFTLVLVLILYRENKNEEQKRYL